MKRYTVMLSKEEREELLKIISSGKHQSQRVINALILLNTDEGEYQEERTINSMLSEVLKISERKIDRVKKRFVEAGLEIGLKGRDSTRCYEKKIDGDFEAHLIALSCGETPEGYARWTLRLLADKVVELGYIDEISHETIRQILKKNELKPWKKECWVIPPEENAEFVAAMEKVLEVYKRPYNQRFPVICMDESSKQLIEEVVTPIPASSGNLEKQDYEYKRNGVCNIFMVNEPLTGKRYVEITEKKTKKEWGKLVESISNHFLEAEKISLLMDNYATHTAGALYEVFEPAKARALLDRFEFVYTPKHGSWLNMAEIELNVLMNQCLNRRISCSQMLKKEVKAWQEHRNNKNSTINWQFKTEDARIKLHRLYPTLDA